MPRSASEPGRAGARSRPLLRALLLATILPAAALAQNAPQPSGGTAPPPSGGTTTQTPANAPLRLVPPPSGLPTAPTEPTAQTGDPPPSAAPASPASGPSGFQARSPSGIEVQTLGRLSRDAGGVSASDALPAGLWSGSDRNAVDQLLARLPTRLRLATARDLARRLLSAPAAPPSGESGARGFAGLRLERLALLGDPAASAALAAAVPGALEDEAGAAAVTETMLLAGDSDAACARTPELLTRFHQPVWQKYQIICQVAAGQAAAAILGVDLLRELGDKDETFFKLAEGAAAGTKLPVKGVNTPTPPQLALIRAAGRGLPAEVAAESPAALSAIAQSAETPIAVRLAAAEKAAALGSLDGRALEAVYRAVPVPPAELKAAPATVAKKAGPQARALLVQALLATESPAAKAELLKLALERADTSLLAGAYGALLAAQAGLLPPGDGFGFVAPHLARLLLLQGRSDLARPWVELARREPGFDRLWPLAALSGLVRASEVDLGGWLDRMGSDTDPALRGRLAGVLALLVAVGEPVDPALRLRTLGGNRGPFDPDPTVWYRLERAGSERRVGEAALLSLILLGEGEPHPLAVAHAAVHLGAVGLTAEARRLATEAAAALLPLPG